MVRTILRRARPSLLLGGAHGPPFDVQAAMGRFLDDWNKEDEVETPPTRETAPPPRRGLLGWLFRR